MSSITTTYIDPETGKKVKDPNAATVDNGSSIYAAYANLQNASGTDYLSGAQQAARQAAQTRTDATLAAYDAQKPVIAEQYDNTARQAYQGYKLGERGLANSLASAGLYNSGYSDTNKVQYNTSYREAQNSNQQARVAAYRDLENAKLQAQAEGNASLSEVDAQYLNSLASQWNTDRSYNYQQQRDALSDQRYDAEWAYQQAQSEYDNNLNKALVAAQYGDFSGLTALGIDATDYVMQSEEDRAWTIAENAAQYGDYSKLQALGVDTTALEAAAAASASATDSTAEADAILLQQALADKNFQQAAQATNANAESGALYGARLAQNANAAIANGTIPLETWLNQLYSSKNSIVQQYGEDFWNAYITTALANISDSEYAKQIYAAQLAEEEANYEPSMPYEDYVSNGIKALGGTADAPKTPTYESIWAYANGTDLTNEQKAALADYLYAYFGIE